jgi:hypothetical protein
MPKIFLSSACFFFRSADTSVCMFDRRNLTSNGVGLPVYKFEGHKAAVLCVQVLTNLLFFLSYPKPFSSKF